MFTKINKYTQNFKDNRSLLTKIRRRINNLQKQFNVRPSLFLTESDVKCNLFREITKIESLNPILNPPLVFTELAEVIQTSNTIYSDMTIFAPGSLVLDMESEDGYINKNFYARGNYIDIEIKLYRNDRFSNDDKNALLRDMDKLLSLSNLHQDNRYMNRGVMLYGFILVVVRSNSINQRLTECINRINVEINNANIELILVKLNER